MPRSYIKSSKLSIFSKHVPCSAIQTIWKPTFLFSDAPKDNDSASTFKFDLNKKLAENIDINVEEKIISAKNGDKTISYQCKYSIFNIS